MKLFYSLRSAFFFSVLAASPSVFGQMTGGSVFLKGNYVEAGICANGDFGAATPPTGYHPHPSTAALGFVADPDMDGWTTGTPAYKGDFFTPGSPFEGWNLQIGSIRAQAQSCAGFGGTGGLTGANTAYTTSGSKLIATWMGSFDSLIVKQVTTLDTLGLYFTMRITLTNTASTPKNDIYYFRSVDPDNDQSWPGGSFVTKNKIEYQLPNTSNATVVSARGTVDVSSFLALGTADTNAKCVIYSAWPVSSTVDIGTIFSTSFTGTYAMGDSVTNDVAIGLAFRVAHLAPVDSASDSIAHKTTSTGLHPANDASFTYFYAFRPDAVDSAIKALTPVATPTVSTAYTVNTNTQEEVKIYPNPSRDHITITGLTATDHITLYDLMGKIVNQNWKPANTPSNSFSMNNIAPGMYILVINDENGNAKARTPIRKL